MEITKKKKRFLCDVDGIIADFVRSAIKVMNSLSGQEITPEHIIVWEVTEALTDPKHRVAAKAEFNKKGFCASFETYDGAQSAIRIIKEVCELYFVTAPMKDNYDWMPERTGWLVEHFEVPHSRVNFISDKFIASGDFLLDDSNGNVELWLAHNPNGTAILWDRPWNRNAKIDPRIVRVSSWAEVIALVDSVHESSGR